jgi:hypothetical protein
MGMGHGPKILEKILALKNLTRYWGMPWRCRHVYPISVVIRESRNKEVVTAILLTTDIILLSVLKQVNIRTYEILERSKKKKEKEKKNTLIMIFVVIYGTKKIKLLIFSYE